MNPLAQVTGLLPNRLSILAPTPGISNNPAGNPDDLREVALDFAPIYKADETLVTLKLAHETDNYSFTAVAGYQDTSVSSRSDYTVSVPRAVRSGGLSAVFLDRLLAHLRAI